MKLSDAFEIPAANPALELKVIQLNINAGYNKALMEKCRPLYEYSSYVACVRKYAKSNPLLTAVELAVKECIKNGILSVFLQTHRAEAINMSIFEYDEEREMALLRQDILEAGYEEGIEKGMKDGIKEGIEQSIPVIISLCREMQFSDDAILNRLTSGLSLSAEQAKQYLARY